MARRHQGEVEFGSDSFLDVIANVVGILIILIVIAGVRMKSAPVTPEEIATFAPDSVEKPAPPATAATVAEQPVLSAPLAEPQPEPEPEPVAVPKLQVVDAPPLQPPAPAGPSPELVRTVEQLRMALAVLRDEKLRVERDEPKAGAVSLALQQQLDDAKKQVQHAGDDHENRLKTLAQMQSSIEEVAGKLALARRQLEALEKSKPPAHEIKHSVTPISRTVKGQELHFHLAGGKVSFVPLEDLVDRLHRQIGRQREWLSKYRRHQGEVGPISGFRMRYVVERDDTTVVDELRQGGMMRISVSEWQIRPESDLDGETAVKALKPGSAFQRALRGAGPNTALTFWVYPDSFGLYRDLTEFAHREGYVVAARPLPAGVPIAGSPQGSRSAGQ